MTLVRLHLAIMAVTQDVEGLWVWFAGFLNACPAKVFKPPLPGVLITALTVAAHICLETYKGQFKKVRLLCKCIASNRLPQYIELFDLHHTCCRSCSAARTCLTRAHSESKTVSRLICTMNNYRNSSENLGKHQDSLCYTTFRKTGTIKEPEGYKLKGQEEELRKDF